MTTRWWAATGTLALAWVLAGCAAMATAAEAPGLDGTNWRLSSLAGRTLAAQSTTLTFADGRVAGTDGCNRYSGPYSGQAGKLEVSSMLAGTQMTCAPEVMAQAQAFIAALTGARGYRVAGSQLELIASDGKVLATLTAQSQGLAGTRWQATAVNNGKQAVASVQPGTAITLEFGAQGRASGSAGCNRYTTGYQADGTSLTFSQAAATRMMCAQAGVMEQEQQFLTALGTVATARIEGDRLELRTAAGALAATFTRAD
jgi:heat shock protein HslJ